MAKFNKKLSNTHYDSDEIAAIICWRNSKIEESDLIETWEIPKSTSVSVGIRNGCDWNFYCGAMGIGFANSYRNVSVGETSGQTDYLQGQKYRKRIRR